MFWFDTYYWVLVLPTVIFALIAQWQVTSTFRKYSKVPVRSGMTGRQTAEAILSSAGIYNVNIQAIRGSLTDYFDPKNSVICLSEDVYGASSVAALGVAAHECGHAIQHKVGYTPLVIRNAIIPITRIGSNMAMPLILLGLLFSGVNSYSSGSVGYYLIMAGILCFGLSVLFQVITLPVEFNASHRALDILASSGILAGDEISGARKVLTAAAMTYVAAMAQALANLLRLLLIFTGGRRRD